MMDAVVQLIRNALCCFKDLSVLEGTLFHDASVTRRYLGSFGAGLPDAMQQTTPLEVLISITQMYACLSSSRSGLRLIMTSVGKLRRIVRIVESRLNSPSKDWSEADRLVNDSLIKEAKLAVRTTFIGSLVFPLGVAFFWLAANSWHVTELGWIGGLPALIYALIVMEIALIPLLYFMVADGFEIIAKSKRCKEMVDAIEAGKLSPEQVDVQRYETMTGWAPFWASGFPMFGETTTDETKLVQDEVKNVKETLASWFPGEKKKGEKEDKIKQEALGTAKAKLEDAVPQYRLEGYREFLYFVFNFVAFYGYLMGPLVFFYADEQRQPLPVQSLKFFADNSSADWLGNFAGDFMWTIEPMVILGSPYLIQMAKPNKAKKVKAD